VLYCSRTEDSKISEIEAPHTTRTFDPNFTYTNIRNNGIHPKSDGLFVAEGERRRGIANKLMSTIYSVFIGLDSWTVRIKGVRKSALGFYENLAINEAKKKEVLGGYEFIPKEQI
jgi:GNAT superfamily N-acetyltransferase